jgi:hypothetical protein
MLVLKLSGGEGAGIRVTLLGLSMFDDRVLYSEFRNT